MGVHKKSGKSVEVGEFCKDWIGSGNTFCYLKGGLSAANCPDAQRSGRGDFYWTANKEVCRIAAGMNL